jgi:hypothetical protein
MASPAPDIPVLTYTIPTGPSGVPLHITVSRPGVPPRTLPVPHRVFRETERSPVADLARVILEDFFTECQGLSAESARERAAAQRTALSRVLAARLARGGPAIITSHEITSRLLQHIFSPPHDQYVARYSVPSASSNRMYTVCRKQDGTWTCGCPHWINRRLTCHHIEAAQSDHASYPYIPPEV